VDCSPARVPEERSSVTAMRQGRQRRKHRRSDAKSPAPARAKRLRFGAATGALFVVLVLILMVTSLRHRRHGWPTQLTPGSAAGLNVLLITLDTTRADHLGCYGYDAAETPVLDAIAAEGVRFHDAVTTVPITLPAHATILTGLDPPNHGVRDNGEYSLDAEKETLAEILRGAGYETAAFVSSYVLNARFGLNQGFDVYDTNFTRTTGTLTLEGAPSLERPAAEVSGAAISWFKGRKRDRPFFCWVHYYDPHARYVPPPPFDARFPDQPYDGEIAYMDEQIGVLLRALETDGSKDNTLIVVVGDHGEALGEHGEPFHSKLIYESTMWVPLIFSCPSRFPGPYVVDDAVVSIADIFPTVLELLAIEHSAPCDGRSLIRASADRYRMVYIETLAPYMDHGWSPLYGLRRHEDKYILAPRSEYYDLREDPHELDNRYDRVSSAALAARDTLVAELSSLLAKWPSIEGVLASAQKLDAEAIQRLQSLGYVGGTTEARPDADGVLADPKDMIKILQDLDRAGELERRGKNAEAMVIAQRAAALSPNDPRVLIFMGNLHLKMGRREVAFEAFRTAVANSINPKTRVVTARLVLGAGQPAMAVKFLEPLRESEPDHPGAALNLGIAYFRLARLEEARDTLLRALQLDDKNVETYVNLALCYERLRQPTLALEYAEQAEELAPESADVHYARGLALMQLQQHGEARQALTMAASFTETDDVRILQQLANVSVRLRLYPEALAYYRKLTEVEPERWEWLLGLAKVNLFMGQFDEAEAALQVGLQMAPDEPRLLSLAQRLAEVRGQ